MTVIGLDPERVQVLNSKPVRKGKYVLYWMQQSQREEFNHALEYAVDRANELDQPLLVAFGLTDDYPEANLRHYTFMLEGLAETQIALGRRGIRMVVRKGPPAEIALSLSERSSLVVCDRGYLKHQKAWRRRVASEARCAVVQVEGDVVVPVDVVTEKAEFAARTIRPKIQKHLDRFLIKLPKKRLQKSSMGLRIEGLDISRPNRVLDALRIDRSVTPVGIFYTGGTSQAKTLFARFVRSRLERYEENSNQPQTDDVSHMSMYLHFGQVSPLYLALSINKKVAGSSAPLKTSATAVGKPTKSARALSNAAKAYLEELIIRRELAINFVQHNSRYASFRCLPDWALRTLEEHSADSRLHIYRRAQLENAKTHDKYWNAAMTEMKTTGFMHNYMRMYWGKKVLEWSKSPEIALRTLLYLNNKYFLDGRDPNSYAGVAWVFGLHDRPWQERPVFGKVRYMNASGLERKCDIGEYVRKVGKLAEKL